MSDSTLNEKQWVIFCHAGALAGLIVPFGNIIVPAIIWSMKKEESEWIDDQGKESLNFQISMTIYLFVAGLLAFILIGLPLLFVLGIADLAFIIIAIIKSDKGERYRYPITLRLIK